ncbi:group II intron reverse transcriptase/maturase [Clostridium sp. P21]|uniref:Group II intron reverse transcriptase/maturase n=1 Tax=Clostridium muellerianum TaxID=2716538 RepID=A0A7Y0EKM3_9CLOT|nr:group II intron reverse transcriptase/maturase [Clostridium muellerianum]NMM64797.1 group II intron reverse transcriptase/maturase [Clostridium muellerianum]
MKNTKVEIKSKESLKILKKNKLRYNEYYNMQPTFDNLYKQSKNGSIFKRLYNLMIKDENILLAYRTIKRNKGSETPGTNNRTITYWENQPIEVFLKYIKSRFEDYKPQKVRRKEIPKINGKMRPLGIPCIEDRIIQQCIKQILEPICEAKFHPNSYGFRPNRSTEHAIAYTYKKINLDKCYHIVDIDIKGFFDHVNHGKLLKQMWSLGIRDKKVISIISAMLKAEIDGIGIPTEGVPQGGILSPLLSNIVLNELDWWVSNQWESYNSNYKYKETFLKYKHFRRSCNLKEMYIVRYADDFKIFCKSHNNAKKIFIAVQSWLKERLNLEISTDKSKITNVRNSCTEFLGFKIKARLKGSKFIVKSNITDKAKSNLQQSIKEQVRYIRRKPNQYTMYILNRLIAGIQNYYRIATHINKDFSELDYKLSYYLQQQFKRIRTRDGTKSEEYNKRYGKTGGKEINVLGITMYPIGKIATRRPQVCNQKVCDYTLEGRELLHKNIGYKYSEIFKWITDNPVKSQSVEFNDNRLSLYSAQHGKCIITGILLDEDMEVHHVQPKENGGTDRYKNLILLSYQAHKLIHATDVDIILKYLAELKVSSLAMLKKILKKLNKYRILVGNGIIVCDL